MPHPKLPLLEFTDAEKCEIFDTLRAICVQQAHDRMDRVGDDDLENGRRFIYEKVMLLTLGQDIFTILAKYR